MEDGVKEDPAQSKEPKFLGKAGWVKKDTGRLLASYKDRYIHVEKTEIVVYENENLQICLERLDLENYDKCLELRSAFKKKNRLVLIRAPKSGNKVHDVKFQAQTPEEKDAWIKALSDGINRAKNKIFDEVKIDESSNLEHVTRARPKGNRNRRPPTRIHMKEVASASSDGILRLDLDVPDGPMPNGTHYVNNDTSETPKEAIKVPMPPSHAKEAAEEEQPALDVEDEPQTEPEPSPQKKVLKPPMPPSKEAKPVETPEDKPPSEDGTEKKVLKPPMPPSKEAKPNASPVKESAKEANTDNTPENSPDATKQTAPPPTPPNKPTSNITSNPEEASQSKPDPLPPTPPSKDKKPPAPNVEPNQEIVPSDLDGTTDDKEKEDDDEDEDEKMEVPEKVDEMEPSISVSEEALPDATQDPIITDPTEGTSAGDLKESELEESEESALSSGTDNSSNNECQMSSQLTTATSVPTEPLKKSPGPLVPPKKKLVKPHPTEAEASFELCQPDIHPAEEENTTIITQPQEKPDPTVSLQTASDISVSSHPTEETLKLPLESNSDVPIVVLSLNDPVADSPSLSPLLCRLREEKKERAEEKSVDSGQHSDDDSEDSENGDTLAASTAALRGSHAGLDVLDVSEEDTQITDSLGQITDEPPAEVHQQAQMSSKEQSIKMRPPVPRKPAIRSASVGDLLSESSDCTQRRQPTRDMALSDGAAAPRDDVMNLEIKVALEMETTGELLNKVSGAPLEGASEGMPEDLLAKAMEKLKQADHFLREVKKMKDSELIKNANKRNSW